MLRMFTPVAVVCDRTMIREADALRHALKAAQLDPHFRFGTKIFKHWTKKENK